jgi:hypothetical protein
MERRRIMWVFEQQMSGEYAAATPFPVAKRGDEHDYCEMFYVSRTEIASALQAVDCVSAGSGSRYTYPF